MLNIQLIQEAKKTLEDAIYETSVIAAPRLSSDYELYLKTENLQKTGSFKVRGAYFKISRLSDAERKRGVIACSAGNHAQGVALAAAQNGIRSLICLPKGAPISKVEATKGYGADVCLVDGVYDDAYARAVELQREHGYTFIHPFDDECVIAGQGTVGLEIMQQLPSVDAVVVPVGGGGLISGIGCAVKSVAPRVKVYGVQAAGAPSMLHSLRDGQVESLASVSTIADGIAVKKPGALTFDCCKNYVNGIVTVSDEEIARAVLSLMETQKLVAEGAGAAPLAAILAGKLPELRGKKVCLVVSGGNIDVTTLSRIIDRGLVMSGRKCTLNIDMQDSPGQLMSALKVIADCGANVMGISHDRAHTGGAVIGCFVRIDLETRDFSHIEHIRTAVHEAGFRLIKP